MTTDKIQNMFAEVTHHLDALSKLFVAGTKVTFIARDPDNGEADVLIGNDTLIGLLGLVQRRITAECVAAGTVDPIGDFQKPFADAKWAEFVAGTATPKAPQLIRDEAFEMAAKMVDDHPCNVHDSWEDMKNCAASIRALKGKP